MNKYDEHIKSITNRINDLKGTSEEIAQSVRDIFYREWISGNGLFKPATKSGRYTVKGCGCLTQIRMADYHHRVQGRPDLTEKIRNDIRIPTSHENINLEILPVFAEIQCMLDIELKRK